MEMQFPDVVVFTEEGEAIKVSRANDTPDAHKGHGLYRTLANNMMVGVSTGFEKKLKLLGVGYKAAMQGKNLNLSLGYSHPVIMEIPKGLEVKCDSNTDITVSGYDKVEVGNFAAIIRSKRPPEPYKGKGIRYADEVVIQKEGKRGK
jgi:large subunit ribosomal protein L6